MDIRLDRREILDEATRRYYSDPDFHALVENAVMLTMADRKLIVPGYHNEIREAARLSASFALVLLEKVKSLSPPPQPAQPTMNMLIDERTGESGTALAHLPTPGGENGPATSPENNRRS